MFFREYLFMKDSSKKTLGTGILSTAQGALGFSGPAAENLIPDLFLLHLL